MGLFFRKKPGVGPFISAVIPAAGTSARMGGEDKLRALLLGKPVLAHTLKVFQDAPVISEIIVVTRETELEAAARLCADEGFSKVMKVVRGGASRTESVLCGVLEASPKAKLIAVHDAARPCLTRAVLDETIALALKTMAAAPAVPVTDTLKETEDGKTIRGTPDRARFVHIQTPQCFNPDLIKGALTLALSEGKTLTDDCAAAEALGCFPALSKGDKLNIKITTPEDLAYAELILRGRGKP